MTEANDNSIPAMILRRVKEERLGGVVLSAKETIDLINSYASNLCFDFSKDEWTGNIDDPEDQLYWLYTAIDGVSEFIHCAAWLANALDLTDDELLHIEDDDREYPFIPENWSRDVKAKILRKHIDDKNNAAKTYRKYIALNPDADNTTFEKQMQEAEHEARSLQERLERLERE